MAITVKDITDYIAFPASMSNKPTDAEFSAWVTSCAIKFNGRTGITFDRAVSSHYDLMMSYIQENVLRWHVAQAGYAATTSNQSGSIVYQDLKFLQSHIRDMEAIVKHSRQESPIAFGGDLIDGGYADR
jgi:hypothetical protein